MPLLTNHNEKKPDVPRFNGAVEKPHANNILDSISHNVGKDIGDVAGKASKKASQYMHTTKNYVEHNPFKGIAFAAAAGIAVGSILTMASRQRK